MGDGICEAFPKQFRAPDRWKRILPSETFTRVDSRRTLLGAEKESSENRAPGTGGCKGLILLHPFSEEFRRFPRKATCGWFWWHLLTPKGAAGLRSRIYGLLNLTWFPQL